MPPAPRSFLKHWFAVEAIPLYAILGIALTGATWFSIRQARSPSVIWTKSNPEPWNTVKPDESTKIINVNHKLDKRSLEPRQALIAPFQSQCTVQSRNRAQEF
ncbi:hypothetical protein ACEPAF_6534 [Sanghuangporus sanghuang]